MLPVTRIDHVSFATHSIDESLRWFEAVFGAREVRRLPVEAEGYTFAELELPNAQVGFELIEPLGESSPIAKFLEKNPLGGQHHVCFEVPDIHAAKAEFEAKGARVLGEPRIGAHGTPVFFVHPKDMGGVLVELMQTPEGAH